MSPLVWAALVAAVPSCWSVYLTISTRRKKMQPAVLRVEAEAYQRAQEINKQIVEGLREELERVRGELIELRRALQASARASEQEKRELEMHIAALHRSLTRALALLAQYDIDIPPDLEVRPLPGASSPPE